MVLADYSALILTIVGVALFLWVAYVLVMFVVITVDNIIDARRDRTERRSDK